MHYLLWFGVLKYAIHAEGKTCDEVYVLGIAPGHGVIRCGGEYRARDNEIDVPAIVPGYGSHGTTGIHIT